MSAPTYASQKGTLTAYQYSGGSWHVAYGPVTAELGINGLSDNRSEGDGTTPTGAYGIGTTMYGLGAPLNSRYSYHTLVCGDWWSGVEDDTYNQFLHIPCGQNLPNSEALWQQTVAYQHFAVIDFNLNPTILGKGSGIFLHDDTTSGVTNGCIAIPPTTLDQVLKWLDPAQDPVIRIGTSSEVSAPTAPPGARVAVGHNRDGTLQAFASTVSGHVLTSRQSGPSQAFGSWTDMGLPALAAGAPEVGVNQSGALQVFVRTAANQLLTSWEPGPSQAFGGWADLGEDGQITSDPTLADNSIGTIQIFVQGRAGHILTSWQTGPNQAFGGWLDMGLPAQAL